MFQSSEQINELAAALSKAQSEAKSAAKSASNPHFRSNYAPLHEYMEVVATCFCKHGLSVIHMPHTVDGRLMLHSRILHSSGQWMGCTLPVAVDEKRTGAQAIGSALTYMKRYALGCLTGIADANEDDDGEAASCHEVQVKVESKNNSSPISPISDAQVNLLRKKIQNEDKIMRSLEKRFGSLESIPRNEFQIILRQVENHFATAGA
jgi:hypothetical protein